MFPFAVSLWNSSQRGVLGKTSGAEVLILPPRQHRRTGLPKNSFRDSVLKRRDFQPRRRAQQNQQRLHRLLNNSTLHLILGGAALSALR